MCWKQTPKAQFFLSVWFYKEWCVLGSLDWVWAQVCLDGLMGDLYHMTGLLELLNQGREVLKKNKCGWKQLRNFDGGQIKNVESSSAIK